MNLFGIQCCPVSVPWNRRLQSLTVALWALVFFLSIPIATFTLYFWMFHSNCLWLLALFYIAWYFYDLDSCNKGGRRIEWVRHCSFWKHLSNYFPVRIIKTAELDSEKGNYLLGSHPHGILCSGAFISLATEGAGWAKKFPNLVPNLLMLPAYFQVPGMREFMLLLAASAASPKNIDYLLGSHKNGQAVAIVIGGTREVYCMDRHDNHIDLFLLNRKGFVKKALKHGADLVPTFTFGEAFIFSNMFSNSKGSLLRKMQLDVTRKTGCPVPLFFGRALFNYSFGPLPRRQPLTVVVGKPIPVNKTENPTEVQIEEVHSTYVQALKELYEEYNPIYGDPKIQLNFT